MASEETPLLNAVIEHEDVYKRFSPQQKRVVVSVVSWIGLIPRTSVSSFWYMLSSSYSAISFRFWFFRAVYTSNRPGASY